MAVKVKQIIGGVYAFIEWEKRNILKPLGCHYPTYITREKFIALFVPKCDLKYIAMENKRHKHLIKNIRKKAKQMTKNIQKQDPKILALEAINKTSTYGLQLNKDWQIIL